MKAFPFTRLTALCISEMYAKISRSDPILVPSTYKIALNDPQIVVLFFNKSRSKGTEKESLVKM